MRAMINDLDVIAVGNAIVDVVSLVDDDFLHANQLIKGSTVLVDEARSEDLYKQLTPMMFSAGGSAANSLAAVSSFGGKAGYIGRIKNDVLGQIFSQAVRQDGVEFFTKPVRYGPATARCLVFVSPDAQRTMQTYLGASIDLTIHDIDTQAIASSKVLLIESYLFDPPHAKEATLKAVATAKEAGRKVAMGASDFSCIERHRSDFESFIPQQVDIFFANEQEALALCRKNTIDEAIPHLKGLAPLIVLTLGENGALILTETDVHKVQAPKDFQVVDTGGAGDQYAGGFLYGYANGFDINTCVRYANIAAGEVISHLGPRPRTSLKKLLKD